MGADFAIGKTGSHTSDQLRNARMNSAVINKLRAETPRPSEVFDWDRAKEGFRRLMDEVYN